MERRTISASRTGGEQAALSAAQARWELHLAILHEEERRAVGALQAGPVDGPRDPAAALGRLTAARAQCNDAFQSLLSSIAHRIEADGVTG
jgi:hypothetical protein